MTRYGGGPVGLARARAMALVLLALPGAVFLYNGEELGLPNVELPDAALQDPVWERSGHTERVRDGCRVPLPWDGDGPPFGFTTGVPWLPMPPQWAELTVRRQLADPGSTLRFFGRALALRRGFRFTGAEVRFGAAPPGVLAFDSDGGPRCVLNTGTHPVPLPAGTVLLASAPVTGGRLPSDAAAWLAP